MKTGFFGSSNFSIPFFEVLREKTDLRLVISTEDQPKGRGQKIISNPVKCIAQDAGIQVLTPLRLDDSVLINTIQSAQLDLVVTASYGKIIPKSLLSLTRLGFFNLHPSLLPEYRGAEPIFWQIAHGLTEGGISIFKMTPELDAGDLVDQLSFPIQENDNYTVVESNAIKGGIQLLRKMLTYLEANPTIPVHPQATSPRAFYARKITFHDEEIDWKKPAEAIHNQIRAFSPQIGAYTTLYGKRVKILESKKTNQKTTDQPGTLLVQGKKLFVSTADCLLKIEALKPEGKNLIKSEDFINGYLNKNGKSVFTYSQNR